MNMHYEVGNDNIHHIIVGFDSIIDTYGDEGFEKTEFSAITVDSLYLNIGHENNSGDDDTLLVEIVSLDGNGYPEVGNVLWDDTLIATNFSVADDYHSYNYIPLYVNLLVPAAKEFGVVIKYFGNTLDTCGFFSGFPDNGECTYFGIPYSAYYSSFYPNSYAYWNYHDALLPDNLGSDIYYDCDGSGDYSLDDGANFIQNIILIPRVTIDIPTSVRNNNNTFNVTQNEPNPFNGLTDIYYELSNTSNVNIEIHDITGNLVYALSEGSKPAGKHKVTIDAGNYAKGMYYYTFVVNDYKLTKKMIVQ